LELTGKKIVIIVENLPLPFDRRVWQEAMVLFKLGAKVFIICPTGKNYEKKYEVIDGIKIYRHNLLVEASGALGYFFEYISSLFHQRRLLKKIWDEQNGFDVIQACNPPDLIYLVVKKYKKRDVKFVFDHHDINPELYIAKFGKKDIFYKLLLYFEKKTFEHSDISIATNESYADIAHKRGLMLKQDIFIVRSGPDLNRLKKYPCIEELKKNKKITLGYVGVIGQQEGIDHLLDTLKILIDKFKFNDFHCYICGDGPALNPMKKYTLSLDIGDYITFTGRIPDNELLDILNTSDICINPDIWNEMNDKSTMNKIMEYMALAKPIVQYKLKEGEVSAGRASLYVENNNKNDFAKKLYQLINDEKLRLEMGEFGYKRVTEELHWGIESEKYVLAYNFLFDH